MTSMTSMTKEEMRNAICSGMTGIVTSFVSTNITDAGEDDAYIRVVVEAAALFAKNTRIAAECAGVYIEE